MCIYIYAASYQLPMPCTQSASSGELGLKVFCSLLQVDVETASQVDRNQLDSFCKKNNIVGW